MARGPYYYYSAGWQVCLLCDPMWVAVWWLSLQTAIPRSLCSASVCWRWLQTSRRRAGWLRRRWVIAAARVCGRGARTVCVAPVSAATNAPATPDIISSHRAASVSSHGGPHASTVVIGWACWFNALMQFCFMTALLMRWQVIPVNFVVFCNRSDFCHPSRSYATDGKNSNSTHQAPPGHHTTFQNVVWCGTTPTDSTPTLHRHRHHITPHFNM